MIQDSDISGVMAESIRFTGYPADLPAKASGALTAQAPTIHTDELDVDPSKITRDISYFAKTLSLPRAATDLPVLFLAERSPSTSFRTVQLPSAGRVSNFDLISQGKFSSIARLLCMKRK